MGNSPSPPRYVDNSWQLQQVIAQQQRDAEIMRANIAAQEERSRIERQALERETRKEEFAYVAVYDYLHAIRQFIRFSTRIAPLGQKGIGKSTFLWLCGLADRPAECLDDGTTSTVNGGRTAVDLIGINLTVNQLSKMIAVLLSKEMPNTFVVFSSRIIPESRALAHLMIRDFYVCPIVPSVVHSHPNPKAEPNPRSFYAQVDILKTAGFRTIQHNEPLTLLNGNKAAIDTLFPSGYLEIPSWADYQRDKHDPSAASLNAIRLSIGKHYMAYTTQFMEDELAFLNSIE